MNSVTKSPAWARVGMAALLLLWSLSGRAAETNPALLQEDFPFQGACISAPLPKGNTAMKGLAIRVGNGASVLFDTDLVRMAAGWTGKYITTHGVAFDGGHGGHPKIEGDQKFGTRVVPGWTGERDAFKDQRSEPFGPLPAEWARYDGLYVNGMDVVLAYTVRGTRIYEQPSSVAVDGQIGFVRTFKAEKAREKLAVAVADVENASGNVNKEGTRASLTLGDTVTLAGLAGQPRGAGLDLIGDRIVLRLAQGAAGMFKVVIWNGPKADAARFDALLAGDPRMVDFKKGGPARWPQTVETQGVLAASKTPDGAYVLDSLTAPQNNPWKRRVRFSGVDFFSDGKRAALSTWDGDVWIVSGIDEKLDHLKWRRFSSGMYETLGLKIVKDVIYTSGRDQLTRYYDLNKDGEADYYENFCNLYTSSEGFHEFLFDLQTDARGNFYFAKAGPVNPGGQGFERISASAGTMMKVSPDGRKLE
ncbi:MAG TPA: DUF6797 domain-containing protein, partial [Verrucomicrobiae bacterium]|nr:DUF6797 domain-containing protein [Verrucomicrobiae bacterium]